MNIAKLMFNNIYNMYELRICSFVSPKVSRIPIYRYKYAIHYQRPMVHPTVRQNHDTCLSFFLRCPISSME